MTVRLGGSTSGYVELDAPASAANNTLVLPAGNGSNGQVLGTDGAGNLSWVNGQMVLETAKSSTSGTSVDFTGIPSWVKRISVMLSGVSTNGASLLQLRVGSGSFVSAGYGSQGWTGYGGTTVATVGLVLTGTTSAANIHTGVATLQLVSNNQWVFSSALAFTNVTSVGWTSAGFTPALGGALDRIRLTTDNGTDTFDAGTINLLLEG